MPYIRGPYAQHSSLPSPDTTVIPNARRINFATKRYVLDSDGNYEGMDPTTQRVMLALSWGSPDKPKFITDRDLEKRRQEINAALADLVNEGAIAIERVLVEGTEPGSGRELVDFLNKETGTSETVTRP